MDIHTNANLAFEAYVDDDDIFFAKIRRQILALTADNEDFLDAISAKYNSFRSNVTKRPAGHSMSSSLGYISWLENKNSTNNAVPASLAKLWENSDVTGTGVFIPQAVKSRRDCRPRRMNKDRTQCTRLLLYAGSRRGEYRLTLPPFMEKLLPSLEPETYCSWTKALGKHS